MAKKIKDENGNTYVQKKPFYKRVWFWILVVIVVAVGASMGGKKDDGSKDSSSKASTSQTASSKKSNVPAEYTSALNKAKTYSNTMHMSKKGLYEQLTADVGEKFSAEAAQYAVDNVNADWNANALQKAKDYQSQQSMSPEAIREQLTSDAGEKFTPDEANYAIQHLND
ncbi:Ltp family lipoprotein [Latilactobacillus curvatus]|uniref:Ltp family lipoprotein n=1 Tax=Latilactobacillus curvatus TaxID=28038 RepID=UPI001CBDEF35|nr:Ltp family lipoprotein [Latilactobacillus curvatus]MBZ1504010.1 Ltp family lipoprotein [Latilactobacillus curvatus]